MKKTRLTHVLIAAGLLAAGAAAQAQTFDSPQQAGEMSTMTNGVPNLLTTNSPYPDGTVVYATVAPPGYSYYTYSSAPVVSYSYTYPSVPYVYVAPPQTYAYNYGYSHNGPLVAPNSTFYGQPPF